MRRRYNRKSVIYAGLLILMPLLYFILYGRHGFSDTDHGFIQGLSYRILNGEAPYWNFVYVRPPLSPILHAIEMAILPDGIEVIGSRLLYYGTVWFSVLFAGLSLRYFFNFFRLGLNFWLFLSLAFVFTAHNFPPMPWHTLDAILLAAFGTYLISRGPKLWKVGLGIMMLILAGLCKQPFLILPVAGIMASYSLWGRKQALLGIGIFATFLLIFFVSALFASTREWILAFWEQNTGVTTFGDLFKVGILKYLKALGVVMVLILGGNIILNRFHDRVQARIGGVLGWLFLVGMVWIHAILTLRESSGQPPLFLYTHIMWILGFIMASAGILGKERGAWPLMILLLTAWCGSISWGYPVPALTFTAILFGFIWFVREYFEFEPPRFYYLSIFILVFFGFMVINRFPYRDAPRSQPYYHLGDHYAQLNFVYGGEFIYQKTGDFKQLVQKHGRNFTVLPAFPLAHYLEKATPPIQVDWAHNGEMNWKASGEAILNKLEFNAPVVFLEKDKLAQLNDEGKYGSMLARFVHDKWKKIDETTYFSVYQKP